MTTDTLTDVAGIKVGHVTDLVAGTGCSIILCPPNTVGAVDVRGGAPGTRETDLLRPENTVHHVHGVVLAGGSAFGLASANGVMQYLAQEDIGYETASGHRVPIVVGAILYDLTVGQGDIYPDSAMGYAACKGATTDAVAQGTIGAGTGAICGGLMGLNQATKGGIGSASTILDDGLVVAAMVAVNSVGDIINQDGSILAGLRHPETGEFVGVLNAMRQMPPRTSDGVENTIIGAVATNAKLDKAQAYKVAQMAHDGLARAVHPSHTPYDGDTIFALATGEKSANVGLIGAMAAEVMASAIRNAVRYATTLHGAIAIRD